MRTTTTTTITTTALSRPRLLFYPRSSFASSSSKASSISKASSSSKSSTTESESYLRLHETDTGDWELQSSQVTYVNEQKTCEIDLIATVHVGEKEYYKNLERDLVSQNEENPVLFELLTDERNVERMIRSRTENTTTSSSSLTLPRLKVSLSPTDEARRLAASHGLIAQLDAIDFKKPNWYLADCSSNELEKMKADMSLEEADTEAFRVPALIEAFLVTIIGRARTLPRAGQFARSLVWLVPCPEAHLLLLDWIWGGGRPAPVLGAMVDAISAGDIVGARKLAFAQMIVSAQGKNDVYGSGSGAKATIEKRNEIATNRLREALRQLYDSDDDNNNNTKPTTTRTKEKLSVLYGGSHLPGLAKNLETLFSAEKNDDENENIENASFGGTFSKSSTIWRTVWRIPKKPENAFARFGFLPLLLLVDGFDWAQTLDALAEASRREKLVEIFLYVLRHVAAYYALGKWVLEWNRDLFEEIAL
ncbi:unnamed protein product [Bathycoccus prasinos]